MNKAFFPALALASFATVAAAHVSLEQTEAAAGSTTKITLRVPHGCAGEATNAVRIDLPEGVYAAKPMPKAGWTLETVTGSYATPFDNHGTETTEGVRQIVWSDGNLEDAWYDEFTFRATIGPDVAPGTTLFFPAVQTCASGTADWTDTSESHDVPNPAPKLKVVAAVASYEDHAMGAGMAAATEYKLGDLTLTAPFSRATLPNAPVAGGFLRVTNTGTTDDRLIGASSEAAGYMEMHEMAMEGDVMKMRELGDGLPIPAGETVELKPGGYHIMFMELQHPLVEGETVAVTLTFEKAGQIEIPLLIGAPNAREAGHAGHDGSEVIK
jgi:periplasmic copper chaperone A